MNPVAHFERTARSIWAARIGPEQKSIKLAALSDQIANYISRFDELPEEKRSQDEWAKAAVDRARKYLEALESDIRHLAVLCRQPS